MSRSRPLRLACWAVGIAGAVLQLSACSSPPKPAVADGSSREPANDPARVQALQQQVASDRALLSENNLLKLQIQALQLKLNEMTTIVREALVLPPAAAAGPLPPLPPAVPAGPLAPEAGTARNSLARPSTGSADAAIAVSAFSEDASGVVVRVFHPFAKTDFEPSDAIAKVLRERVRTAERVEVRGHTDSNVINPADKLIAIERAEKARTWLIANGADPLKVRMLSFSAGHFLADNTTAEGRAQNRRVEIDIRDGQAVGVSAASSN